MMRMCTSTIVSIVLVSLAFASVQADYGRLDKYLVEHVKNEDISANMEAASNWLKEQSIKKAPFFSMTPISDLKKFTALQRVIDDTQCDGTVYEIMRANDEASGLYKLDAKVTRRVDRVILDIFKRHAERCHAVYPLQYDKLEQQLEGNLIESTVNLAKTLMVKDGVINPEQIFYKPEFLFKEYIMNNISVRRYVGSNVLKEALMLNAKADPDVKYMRKVYDENTGKSVVRKDKIKDLVQKHVIEPCKRYTDTLGPNLFIPARFDARFYSRVDKTSQQDYYLAWSCYMICKALIEYDDVVFTDVTLSVKNGN